MDPDRELFEPYWISEHRLVKSMATKDSAANDQRAHLIYSWNQWNEIVAAGLAHACLQPLIY